jgi:hypothetical protein
MSKRQLFYFIQPEILLDTKRYKIGISQSTKYDRIKNYGAKARLLLTLEDIANVKDFEKVIIKKFNKKFKSIGGNEYFEGCEYLMSNTIYQEYIKYKYNKEVQIKDLDYESKEIFYISSDDEESVINSPLKQVNYDLPNIGVKTNYNNNYYYQNNFAINFKLIQNEKLRKKRLKKQRKRGKLHYCSKLLNKKLFNNS